MKHSNIEWTHHTFNPWVGCTKVSPGCDHCYAEAWDRRFAVSGHAMRWGQGKKRQRTSSTNWKQPLRWNREAEALGIRYRVFCASLADVFDNQVPTTWRQDLFALIERTPQLDWLLLTKRVGNVRSMVPAHWISTSFQHGPDPSNIDAAGWPPNVWLGASICNQEEADREIPKLIDVPASVRFLSMEPLLGPVDLTHLNSGREVNEIDSLTPYTWEEEIDLWRDSEEDWRLSFEDHYGRALGAQLTRPMHNTLDWIIVGGESGPDARPMHPDWVRSLRDQCETAGVPFHFKQWGEWREPRTGERFDTSMGRAQQKPAFIVTLDGMVHCFETEKTRVNGKVMLWVGKKAARRLLDGRTWDKVPRPIRHTMDRYATDGLVQPIPVNPD